MLRRLSLLLSTTFVLIATVPAQVVQHESLTKWTHLGSSPSWTDDLPDVTAEFALVDQLNSTTQLEYKGSSQLLEPGTYIASCRVKKLQSTAGAADITLDLTFGSTTVTSTLAKSAQTTDKWVRVPHVTFTVLSRTSVGVRLHNMDTNVTKQNYHFDSLVIGRVGIGDIAYYQSMVTWPHRNMNNTTNYVYETQNNESAAGICCQLNWVDNLEFTAHRVDLPPGTYTAHARIMKTSTQLQKAVTLDFEVSVNGVKSKVSINGASQPPNVFVHTPRLTFTVKANDTVDFRFGRLGGSLRVYDYVFDALIVRPGVYEYYGSACPVASGDVELDGGSAWMGRQFHTIAKNAPNGGVFNMGMMKQNIDLGIIGLTGCSLLTSIDASVSMTASGLNASVVSFPVPVNPVLLGVTFYTQAIAIVPGANILGMVTSNAGEVKVVQ